MTRNEFLDTLRSRLSSLPAEEAETALRYYEEYLDEAEDEENAISKLGSPEQIAARILAEYDRQDAAQLSPVPAPDAADKEQKPSEKQKRSPWKTVWLVFLLICASPLLIALGAAALSIVIALLAVLMSVILAVIAPFLAMSLAFIAVCFVLLGTAGSMVGIFTPGAVLMIGLALLFGALGIVCGIFTGYLCKWCGMLLKLLFRSLRPETKGVSAA